MRKLFPVIFDRISAHGFPLTGLGSYTQTHHNI